MQIISAPRQSGRTTRLLINALADASINGSSIVVVPDEARVYETQQALKAMDKELAENVLVLSMYSFCNGHAIGKAKEGRRFPKAFIDDLDMGLWVLSGYNTAIATIEEK